MVILWGYFGGHTGLVCYIFTSPPIEDIVLYSLFNNNTIPYHRTVEAIKHGDYTIAAQHCCNTWFSFYAEGSSLVCGPML